MVLDDLIRLAKKGEKVAPDEVAAAMKAAGRSQEAIDFAKQGYRVVNYQGQRYKVNWWLTDEEAKREVWNKVLKPQFHKSAQTVDMPSELSSEQLKAIAKKQKLQWDTERGMGNIPDTSPTDFGYLGGFVRDMKPKEFLKHAYPEPNLYRDTNYQSLISGLAEGKPLSPPTFWAKWDPEKKAWAVQSHEGRHRSAAVESIYGDVSMPVHIVPRTADGYPMRAKDITDEMRKAPVIGVGSAVVIGTGEPDTSNVTPIGAAKMKKIEPGIYLDEDTGNYYRVNKDGSFDNLGAGKDETPED